MMDTMRGGIVGVVKPQMTEMIDKYKGSIQENDISTTLQDNSFVENGFHKCRHCSENFSTLLGLQQHIVCDHTEELRTEINKYQHKKHRILEESGGMIHPKKRKILESQMQNMDNDESKQNGHNLDSDEDDDRLVINTSPTPAESYDENSVEDSTSYTHKKLKRKDYLVNKSAEVKESLEKEKEYERILDRAKREVDMERNKFRSNQKDSFFPSQNFSNNVVPHPNENVSTQPPQFDTSHHSQNVSRTNSQFSNSLPQPQGMPAFPAINMNMYGNFAMPMNFTHPMMMNPGMFMPPMATPNPSYPAPENVMSHIPPSVPHAPAQEASSSIEKVSAKKSSRPSSGNRRSRVSEKKQATNEEGQDDVVEIYECKVCSRKFSQVGNFHNHMKLHKEKNCSCGICKLEFSDSYELQRHMRTTHTGNMPYKCNECDREFSQYNNLRRHLRVHSGKSYKCHICGRSFNEVFYLEMHIGSHTGERTYKCGVCSLAFRDNAELQKHVKTHSADELHTCDVCGKSFSKACVLRQHKKMHLGIRPYKCQICEKAFIHRHHLTIHMRMHNTSKPFICKLCHREFTQTSHLYKHIEKQHAEEIGKSIDPNFKNKNGESPSAAEIEALFSKIHSPSNHSLGSSDGVVTDVSSVRSRSDSNVSLPDSSYSSLSQISIETPSSSDLSPAPQYSPISSASSQCDLEHRSVTPITELNKNEEHKVPTENSFHSANYQESMSQLNIHESEKRNPGLIDKANLSFKLLENQNLQNSTQCKSEIGENVSDFKPNVEDFHGQSQGDVCAKAENFRVSASDIGRSSDTDKVSHDTVDDVKLSNLKTTASPCSSLNSDTSNQQSEQSSTYSPESYNEKTEVKNQEKPKKKRRRKKKTDEQENKRRNETQMPIPAQNGFQMQPNNAQNGFTVPSCFSSLPMPNPSAMPRVTSDMQHLYLMQMQQLQGLHMALFANAMATQTLQNGGGKLGEATGIRSYGNLIESFPHSPHQRSVTPDTPFHNPLPMHDGKIITPTPVDLSLEKR